MPNLRAQDFHQVLRENSNTNSVATGIEGQFRKIRKDAERMRAEVDTGVLPQAPPRGSIGMKEEVGAAVTPKKTSKQRTPKKDGVLSGRVTKSITPTKKRAANANAVKGVKEEMESSAESMMEDVLRDDSDAEDGCSFSLSVDELQQNGFGSLDGYLV